MADRAAEPSILEIPRKRLPRSLVDRLTVGAATKRNLGGAHADLDRESLVVPILYRRIGTKDGMVPGERDPRPHGERVLGLDAGASPELEIGSRGPHHVRLAPFGLVVVPVVRPRDEREECVLPLRDDPLVFGRGTPVGRSTELQERPVPERRFETGLVDPFLPRVRVAPLAEEHRSRAAARLERGSQYYGRTVHPVVAQADDAPEPSLLGETGGERFPLGGSRDGNRRRRRFARGARIRVEGRGRRAGRRRAERAERGARQRAEGAAMNSEHPVPGRTA